MPETHVQEHYIQRVNAAIQYIHTHLAQPLTLEIVAAQAHYSAYHFHRIFNAITDQTLNDYINRKRIEKAAAALIRDKRLTIAEIATNYGFNSNAAFTRAFKRFYGMSPTEFKKNTPDQYSKISKIQSKKGEIALEFQSYICNINNHKNWIAMNATIEVKQLAEINLAYVAHTGPFQEIGQAYGKLMQWAGPKGLLNSPDAKTITVYHDDPNVTEESKLRQSAGVLLSSPVKTEGEIGSMTLPAGKFAVGRFEIPFSEFQRSWQSMFVWINENGYKATGEDCFEIYHNNFNTHPQKKSIIDICIPLGA